MENNLENLLENENYNLVEARKANRKIIFSYLIYFLSINILASLTGFIQDIGIRQITIVGLGIIPIYFFVGKKSLENLRSQKQKYFGIKDLFFFVGLSYAITLIFSIFTNFVVSKLNIPSPNVTKIIQNNLNITLFIYAVIFGPAIEELQFRGFYLNITRKYGKIASILLVSILFSFSHLNIIQGLGTFGLALVFTYVAYFYSFRDALILHIINNLIVAIVGFLSSNYGLQSMQIVTLSIILIILGFSAIVQLFTEKRRNEFKNNLKIDKAEKKYLKNLFTDYVFIVYFIFILAFSVYAGYIAQNAR
ncbi:CPBP family intramembrane metalloprotease [Helcococcus ovis]|uniref:CPBP family intramembrane glutamic endopeptidase n=1 Tax=Helcococcus ovis TaxID=72026 RepID=UPI00106F3C16|nr:type II CAAX endopeptidase family protein [Helcococcus ovis]TFF67601.1 CPBP family intramembrane metalloprotease [Helcococcus ovis]WNZ00979.1 type II CAAX endopeptidase family protein [Helcococcus ovis]